MWPDHAPFRDVFSSLGYDLLVATINLPTKLEVSISDDYEDMKRDS